MVKLPIITVVMFLSPDVCTSTVPSDFMPPFAAIVPVAILVLSTSSANALFAIHRKGRFLLSITLPSWDFLSIMYIFGLYLCLLLQGLVAFASLLYGNRW